MYSCINFVGRSHKVGSMLCHRLRRWPNIEPTLSERYALVLMDNLGIITYVFDTSNRLACIKDLKLIYRLKKKWYLKCVYFVSLYIIIGL